MTDKMLNAGGESGRHDVAAAFLRARSRHNWSHIEQITDRKTKQRPCRPADPGGAAIMTKQQGERKSL